ncbi:MAG: 16S rRNA (guanine(527)-N(7))-methyltransferase RsmG [Bacilli bacterium]|nr:16S rRNA (guanine(527)-N(7))-methyltransferase RsmG [Bacilli bacterium]
MDKEYLESFIKNELHQEVDGELLKFSLYEKLLKEWNEKFNLTAITDDEGILEKHFIDSIYPMKFVDFKNKSLCDIGTGAGFPGIPLAILNPSLKVTLVESNGKKVAFLNEVVNSLSLDNVIVVKSRAEEFKIREEFDYVSARAVTQLNVLSELSIPLLKVNGELLAYKLFDVEEEVKNAFNALKVLDSKIERIEKYKLPISGDGRSLVIVRKLKATKKKYPRQFSEISSKPL